METLPPTTRPRIQHGAARPDPMFTRGLPDGHRPCIPFGGQQGPRPLTPRCGSTPQGSPRDALAVRHLSGQGILLTPAAPATAGGQTGTCGAGPDDPVNILRTRRPPALPDGAPGV
ncbi:hypothetical protein GCM10011374_33040 [Kocuria dechangensis]|uniref:Uncharacterized protein n=1 Tax=Kocuria dechangensis TaxID=1176249 RepID=A0A917LZP3_9MICC|nr:hypothetical protein GCM10011374_33040 [Kocuria dechangensis]